MLLVLHNVTMASLRTFARKVAADDETWRNNNQTWARANFSFFIYFLFQIKWHFDFFFTEKWGVDINPIHPPCIRPCLLFRTHILSISHFDKMSDGVLYEGFGIMQASKNHFKTFAFLMEELPIRWEFERTARDSCPRLQFMAFSLDSIMSLPR